jgi:hypothetical protein
MTRTTLLRLLDQHAAALCISALSPRQLPDDRQQIEAPKLSAYERVRHLAWCLDQIRAMPAGAKHRQQRWLGFVQGALWAAGLVSLAVLRQQTRGEVTP